MDSPRSTRFRVTLLGAQAFALGLTVAWTTIPANAIFLGAYGSAALPWTYVAAAFAGGLASVALTRAFRRRTLVAVTMRVLVAFAVVLAVSFVGLRASGPWVSVILLVLLPIMIPVGFIFVVGQAGMLLDVRVLKALYGRVVGGFAMGFLAGGLVAPPVLSLFGATDSLVALAAVVGGVFAAIVGYTQRCFPELSAPLEVEVDDVPRPTLGSLARNRYIVLLALFQMLSAIESQWLDYLVYDRAAQRYPSAEELADFISRFTAISYGADIVFLLVFAGLVLRRFGLRLGLVLDAATLLLVVLTTIVATVILGSASTLVFVLIVAARVIDLTLGDGASRTSIGAAYQAVPTRERLASQAAIEGLAFPVAVGISGVVLIVVGETVGTAGLLMHVLTSLVLGALVMVGVLVFRGYRVNLLANLRHRSLDPAALAVDDANTLAAIDRLIDGDNEREIRLGVHTLFIAGHPLLPERLARLTTDDRVGVRSFALECLLDLDPAAAAHAARDGVDHPNGAIRSACVRALGATADPADAAAMTVFWADPHHDVRIAAAAAIGRLGDLDVLRRLSDDVYDLARSKDPTERVLAAEVLACCGPDSGVDRRRLAALLDDDDPAVVQAALRAVHWPADEALLEHVVVLLEHRRTSAAAVEALARGGPAILDLVDAGLRAGSTFTHGGQRQLVRVCRDNGTDDAVAVLLRHLGHRDRELGLAIARALASSSSALVDERVAEVIRGDLHDATHVIRAQCVFMDAPEHGMLSRALLDLRRLLEQRVVACLAIRYGAANVHKVGYQLAQNDARSHALAIEWMEVTFTGSDRAAIALMEPGLSDHERLRRLTREFAVPAVDAGAILRDLVEDPEDRWRRPWIAACALLANLRSEQAGRDGVVFDLTAIDGSRGGEDDAVVHETLAGIRRRVAVGDK